MMVISGKSRISAATTCGECLKNSLPYDRVISAFHYEPPVSDFITQLKYSAQFQLLPILSDYLIQKIQSSYESSTLPTLIIATPLHPKKLVTRGFNQSRLIANKVGKALNLRVLDKGVERIKHTQAQSGLDSVERKKNMKNAFLVQTHLPKHVAIVDDVVTTGMTATELAKQLLKHGCKRIDIWCLARAYDL
ncbi:MAG: ComF family protein [Kangiellaceae bacterium]|nr:ComF family protein [Kangiellaceae bacterium]